MRLENVNCCICNSDDAVLLGMAKDYEYQSTDQTFRFYSCSECSLVYLNPRPASSEFSRIYPSNYHAYDFSEEDFGFVFRVRSRLEARRALTWCTDIPDDARIVDVGCGDGFHLKLLQEYGKKSWSLEGVDVDERAVSKAREHGLNVHHGRLQDVSLPVDSFDLAFMIQTIEHLGSPPEVLHHIHRILKPGGKLVIVTDNTGSLDFGCFKSRFWGGYHTPRHWNLFNKHSLRLLTANMKFETVSITTQVSPVNWVYTVHNYLQEKKAPKWLVDKFTLKSTVSLAFFTILDAVLQKFNRGALLRGTFKKVR